MPQILPYWFEPNGPQISYRFLRLLNAAQTNASGSASVFS
jgi:hypothetical protein